MEMYVYDFNHISAPAKELIPEGTVVRVRLSIEAGGQSPEGLLTRAKNADMYYLHAILTVTEGLYANRTLHHRFAVRGTAPQDRWALRGLQDLRRVLESARNVAPSDFSEDDGFKVTVSLTGSVSKLKLELKRAELRTRPLRGTLLPKTVSSPLLSQGLLSTCLSLLGRQCVTSWTERTSELSDRPCVGSFGDLRTFIGSVKRRDLTEFYSEGMLEGIFLLKWFSEQEGPMKPIHNFFEAGRRIVLARKRFLSTRTQEELREQIKNLKYKDYLYMQ